jgi:Flp pilus assembly protein TadG
MNRKSNRSRGQIAVILAVVLPVVVGVVALGADFAVMYFNWVQLQKAADSAALAGAGYLPNDTTGARNAAITYAKLNGQSTDPAPTVTIDGSAFPTWVQVQLSRQVPYSFGRVLGLTSATLNVTAKAGITSVNGTYGGSHTLPMWIDCPAGLTTCPGASGTQITLGNTVYGPGNWGLLQLPGMANSNGKPYFENIVSSGWSSNNPANVVVADPSGTPGCTPGPSCVQVDTGNASLQGAAAGVQDRITQGLSQYPGDSATSFNPNNPRVVEIPIVNATGVTGGSLSVPVLGFAEVWIDSVVGSTMTFTFITSNSPGGVPGGTSTSCTPGNSGPCLVVLEQ